MKVERQKPIFDLLRHGYETLFKLSNDEDDAFLQSKMKDLDSAVRQDGGLEVGIHMRHGDRHPFEPQYRGSYIPATTYLSAASDMVDIALVEGASSEMAANSSRALIASDDPDVYLLPEILDPTIETAVERAQSRISLASKSDLDAVEGQRKQPIDTNVGWEGGFFAPIFWSLGRPTSLQPKARSSPKPTSKSSSHSSHHAAAKSRDTSLEELKWHAHPSKEALALRELVGRAYLLDLAILGQADRVVCGVSSMTCRLLAVMMGWESAIEEGHWRNVDKGFGNQQWKGIIW